MNVQICADQRSIGKPENVETTVGYMTVENGVRRVAMYGLGDEIVSTETGNVINTRVDHHP